MRDFLERILIDRIFKTLNLSDEFKNLTIKLINKAKTQDLINNHYLFREYVIATIYLIGKHLKIKFIQEKLVKKLNISRHTIYDRINDLKLLDSFLD